MDNETEITDITMDELGVTGGTQETIQFESGTQETTQLESGLTGSTQDSTQDEQTQSFQTPTVPTRRRGRPSQNDPLHASSRERSSSTSTSTRSSARRRVMSGDTQLLTPSTASLLQSPHSFDMSSTQNSIRDSARIQSISTGSQQNATNRQSSYNINYRIQQQQSIDISGTNEHTNDTHNASAVDDNRDAISDAIMPSELPHAPNSPIHGMQDLDQTNASGSECHDRTCICHDKIYPKNCTFCKPNISLACNLHVLIQCAGLNCQKQFHKSCICHLLRLDLSQDLEINSYMCMECTCTQQATNDDVSSDFNTLDLDSQMKRLGLHSGPIGIVHRLRDNRAWLNALIRDMEKCIPPDRVHQFKNTQPLPYPSAVKMNDQAIQKHVLCGRRLEISLMLFDVHKCQCCGRVQPNHDDSTFVDKNYSPPFKSQHLANRHWRVWHCTCWGFCKGSQFFSDAKPTHIEEFKQHHNGQHPKDFLDVSQPNAWMCNTCYNHELTLAQVKNGGLSSLYTYPFLLLCFDTFLIIFLTPIF